MMRTLALAGLLAMAAPVAMAQTGGAQPGTAAGQASGDRPANICQELVAFMKAPAPGQATAAGASTPAQGAASSGGPGASGQAVPTKPTNQTESAGQISGQSGVAVNAPAPNSAPVAKEGTAEAAPQKSSRSAPVPNASQGTPKDSVMSVQEAEELAKANNTQNCREATQKLRRAGVMMPPTLLALAALEPEEPAQQSK
ncbi:MAG: hypothetical protein IRY87_31550 [Acetobacteraceae bacterium]|nr:hypothetical protein [Acetobacteraceae bacterium]